MALFEGAEYIGRMSEDKKQCFKFMMKRSCEILFVLELFASLFGRSSSIERDKIVL